MVEWLVLTREQLYEKVWEKPMLHLAKELGLSDRGLAKACIRLEIPLPGLGYWRKVERGIRVKKIPLPKPSASCQLQTRFRIKLEDDTQEESEALQELKAFEFDPENRITVPERIGKYDPMVQRTLKYILNGYKGLYNDNKTPLATISASKQEARRAVRIFQTLMDSLPERGYTISVTSEGTIIHCLGEPIKVYLRETTKQVEDGVSSWGTKQYKYLYTGKLILGIDEHAGYNVRRVWSDGNRKRLEEQLNSFIVGLGQIAILIKEARLERERWHQEWERQRQIEIERNKRIEHFEGLYEKWRKFQEFQRLLEFIEESIDINAVYEGLSKAEWLVWAKGYATRFDPFVVQKEKKDGSSITGIY